MRRLLEFSRDILVKVEDMHRYFNQTSTPSGVLAIGKHDAVLSGRDQPAQEKYFLAFIM